jgi:putative aminopeptidase FrvX
MSFALLKTLCSIPGASGDESEILTFLVNYISKNSPSWKVSPQIICNQDTQDAIILVFGDQPTAAVMAHVDVVGFTAGYSSELIRIGGPSPKKGDQLVGKDSLGDITCKIHKKDDQWNYLFNRPIDRGTPLTYLPEFNETDGFISSNYLDNRLGVFNALKLAETLENGIIAFSTYEEVGGGNAQVLGKIIYEQFKVSQFLISDITWVTSGVQHHNGVAISARDSGVPRRKYINKILNLAKESKIPFQIEVESAGGSDGNSLQNSNLPLDWCFIGAPEDNVHSPREKVSKLDIEYMLDMYEYLMKNL